MLEAHNPMSLMGPILVVEDDEEMRALLVEVLHREGYTVMVATNGSEALEHLRTAGVLPKLILLDLVMPEMSGGQFCEQLSLIDDCRCIPVFVLTGAGVARAKAETFGAALIFRKPLELSSLLDAVSRVVAAQPTKSAAPGEPLEPLEQTPPKGPRVPRSSVATARQRS
jgi:CheY-like chemotaxis protein